MLNYITKAILVFALFITACTNTPHQNPPVALTAQSVMTAKPCSPLPFDANPSINITTGWVLKTPPAGMPALSCNNKYLDSIYCLNKASCPKSMTWGTATPSNLKAEDIHWIVDILYGSISVCGQYSNRYYTGSGDCKRIICSATGNVPTRCVIPVQSVGEKQSDGPTQVIIDAASDGVIIGAIGTAEVTN